VLCIALCSSETSFRMTGEKSAVPTGTVIRLKPHICFHKVFLALCSSDFDKKILDQLEAGNHLLHSCT
jgi:hypothetical protein